jgi:hypothetical protein
MADQEPLSFAKDIRPLFTDLDVAHMKPFGMDLSSGDDVAKNADAIISSVQTGNMPPASSGEPRWTDAMCALFEEWQRQGCPR